MQYLQWWVMFLRGLIRQLEDRIHFIDFPFLLACEGKNNYVFTNHYTGKGFLIQFGFQHLVWYNKRIEWHFVYSSLFRNKSIAFLLKIKTGWTLVWKVIPFYKNYSNINALHQIENVFIAFSINSVNTLCTSKFGIMCTECNFASGCDSTHLNFIWHIHKLNNSAAL